VKNRKRGAKVPNADWSFFRKEIYYKEEIEEEEETARSYG